MTGRGGAPCAISLRMATPSRTGVAPREDAIAMMREIILRHDHARELRAGGDGGSARRPPAVVLAVAMYLWAIVAVMAWRVALAERG